MPTPSASELNAADPRVARFRDDVAALGPVPRPGAPLAVAVSGGPDSMAMLALAHAAFPRAIAAATVDHRLRPANAEEARMVAGWCSAHAIPHATLAAGDAPSAGENLHVWARGLRYRLLGRWARDIGAGALATAHHADDQAETFLMRAARGAGLSGLAGVRARLDHNGAEGIATIRPLLGWRREELRAIAEAAHLPFVDDPSNGDPRYDRARLRAWLAGPDAPDPVGLARAARQLAEIDADLSAHARALWDEAATTDADGVVRIAVQGLPRTLRRYLAGMAIARIAGARPDRGIESLLDALDRGAGATQNGVMASARAGIWTFRPAPPRRNG